MAKVKFKINEDGSVSRGKDNNSSKEKLDDRINKINGGHITTKVPYGTRPKQPELEPEFSLVGCLYGVSLIAIIVLIVKFLFFT